MSPRQNVAVSNVAIKNFLESKCFRVVMPRLIMASLKTSLLKIAPYFHVAYKNFMYESKQIYTECAYRSGDFVNRNIIDHYVLTALF